MQRKIVLLRCSVAVVSVLSLVCIVVLIGIVILSQLNQPIEKRGYNAYAKNIAKTL